MWLTNLALLYETHHHTVHERGWTLEPTAGGGWLARGPTGLERTRPPRRDRQLSPDPPADAAQPEHHEQPDWVDPAAQLGLLAS